ncbi:hypothetical protein BASA83_002691 [Batrachochytrium salamandrivorans]|nr:hypothetical protein BASA83_002691 [Batrachochytrium salamandrivorans]
MQPRSIFAPHRPLISQIRRFSAGKTECSQAHSIALGWCRSSSGRSAGELTSILSKCNAFCSKGYGEPKFFTYASFHSQGSNSSQRYFHPTLAYLSLGSQLNALSPPIIRTHITYGGQYTTLFFSCQTPTLAQRTLPNIKDYEIIKPILKGCLWLSLSCQKAVQQAIILPSSPSKRADMVAKKSGYEHKSERMILTQLDSP